VNGVRSDFRADGSVLSPERAGAVRTSSLRANAKARATARHPSHDEKSLARAAFQIGDEMEDGTIYAGISPDTGKPMYATPSDAPGTYTFNESARYAKNLDAHGHKDWRPPSNDELFVLYANRHKGKLKETFEETRWGPAEYWSSSLTTYDTVKANGHYYYFSFGSQFDTTMHRTAHLRCVR
jgi:hypothetical protein